jgi:hypothetical protein
MPLWLVTPSLLAAWDIVSHSPIFSAEFNPGQRRRLKLHSLH